MTGRDKLYGQNWIEQWRENVPLYPIYYTGYRTTADVCRNELTFYHLVHYGFVWSQTPQHPDGSVGGVWEKRQYGCRQCCELVR